MLPPAAIIMQKASASAVDQKHLLSRAKALIQHIRAEDNKFEQIPVAMSYAESRK